MGVLERADLALGLAARLEPEDKAVAEGRAGLHWRGVMLGTGADMAVEDVPMPQPAIASEIDLAGADAADGHPDAFEVRPAVHGALASSSEGLHPLGPQLLVRRDQLVEVLPREGAGHGLQLANA